MRMPRQAPPAALSGRMIGTADHGLKQAIAKALNASWQRCRVHWLRNALAHVPKSQHTIVAAALRQAFLQADQATARQTWRQVADQLRPRWPKLGTLMDESEYDVLAYMAFPNQHRVKLHSTNPLERLNKEVKRRADVVGSRASLSTPQRGLDRAPDWGRAVGAERRVAAPAPLHAAGSHGRTRHASPADRATTNSTHGRLSNDHLRRRSNLHPVDGRNPALPPSLEPGALGGKFAREIA